MKIVKKNLPRLVEVANLWKKNPIILPQHRIPKPLVAGSSAHKIMLFYFCFLTPRSHSALIIQKIQMLLQRGVVVEDLFAVLTSEKHVPFFTKQLMWMEKGLQSLGGLDNISHFEQWSSVDEYLRDRGSFPGWGPKLYSLYRMSLEEMANVRSPDDAFPVDAHIISLLTKFGIFEIGDRSRCIKNVAEFIRSEISCFLVENDLRPWQVHNPLWQLGSGHCGNCTEKNLGCNLSFCSRETRNSEYWKGILQPQ